PRYGGGHRRQHRPVLRRARGRIARGEWGMMRRAMREACPMSRRESVDAHHAPRFFAIRRSLSAPPLC
ncbi:hypothetical protein, partial [Klebsiella aerogenes]|uniref:hypothetical protein n=1 Tax=Klebsiella aerogenes TaxID=548 RepID=UPI001953B7C2